jgi:hypothetical protein
MSDLISRKVVSGEKAMVAQVFLKNGAEALETLLRDAGGPEGLHVNVAIQVAACAAVIVDPRTLTTHECLEDARPLGSVRDRTRFNSRES